MSTSAIVMLIFSTTLIWGGLVFSIVNAKKATKRREAENK
ncbi:methionine/alanine import family NSS transporter small subunit [Alkalicoccobacillus porphyridii]|uniref:Methionine/alanine import family NSS transporter small subunit n=1 Tax=Alkalicoccobacillus porphyridii TaxID=2597270 RepID=A0A554A3F1_9BACI|nr:methionine/alanine import family NSS transporter small subunit [Alkalicoccobacillus porphyridii]TSB48221.1 methionine/alanine import family NSS transporter small subunit [Alkalicoccobacillus porphyridii]